MNGILVNILRATPIYPNVTCKKNIREFFKYCILCASTLSISGCITSDYSVPPASPPEEVFFTRHQNFAGAKSETQEVAAVQDIYLSPMLQNLIAQGVVNAGSVMAHNDISASIESEDKGGYKCRWKDRLDRKAVLAYEWDRSRLSMDVDGINMSGSGEYGIHVKYRLRFQPEKKPKEKCRYDSEWQGMIGTGYYEFFVREDDRVWQELKQDVRDVRKKVTSFTDRVF